jgi:DNA-binding response OmpR family regulator
MDRKPAILIVEDEEKAAEILQLYLAQEGYKTLVAHNGKDALAYPQKQDDTFLHRIIAACHSDHRGNPQHPDKQIF